jgi:hypothetical protein
VSAAQRRLFSLARSASPTRVMCFPFLELPLDVVSNLVANPRPVLGFLR